MSWIGGNSFALCNIANGTPNATAPITTNINTANNHLMWLQAFIIRSTTGLVECEWHVDLLSWTKLLTNRR